MQTWVGVMQQLLQLKDGKHTDHEEYKVLRELVSNETLSCESMETLVQNCSCNNYSVIPNNEFVKLAECLLLPRSVGARNIQRVMKKHLSPHIIFVVQIRNNSWGLVHIRANEFIHGYAFESAKQKRLLHYMKTAASIYSCSTPIAKTVESYKKRIYLQNVQHYELDSAILALETIRVIFAEEKQGVSLTVTDIAMARIRLSYELINRVFVTPNNNVQALPIVLQEVLLERFATCENVLEEGDFIEIVDALRTVMSK
jgi:hypothetical protein